MGDGLPVGQALRRSPVPDPDDRDCHTREALATVARTNFRAYHVVEELNRIARTKGKPRSIRVDNGPEFAGRLHEQWAYLNKAELDFSRPGKPTDNAFIEAFNSRLRQECLNASR